MCAKILHIRLLQDGLVTWPLLFVRAGIYYPVQRRHRTNRAGFVGGVGTGCDSFAIQIPDPTESYSMGLCPSGQRIWEPAV